MKNIRIISITLLGAMIALASCQREDVPHNGTPEENGTPISFSAIHASLDTKGDDSGTEDGSATGTTTPEISSFHVWASRNESSNDIFGTHGTTVTAGNNGLWIYSPVRYWQTGTYNFAAISPLSISENIAISGSIDNGELSLSFGTENSDWNLASVPTDLLIAEAASVTGRVNSTSPQSVSLTFTHLLSQIYFEAMNADANGTPIEVTKVEISGHHKVASEFTYNMLAEDLKVSWEYTDDGSALQNISLSAAKTLSGSYQPVTSNVMVFSQECDLVVKVTIKDKENDASTIEKSGIITDANWAPGIRYKYNISISPDKIIFDQVSVQPWATGEVADDLIIM